MQWWNSVFKFKTQCLVSGSIPLCDKFYVKDSQTDYWDGYSTARAKQHIEFFKYFTYQRLTQGILS